MIYNSLRNLFNKKEKIFGVKMKKIICLCVSLLFLCISCRTAKNFTSFNEYDDKIILYGGVQYVDIVGEEVKNHSFLTKNDVGINLKIRGELRFVDDEWILVESPESKSAVTFSLINTENFEELLKKNFDSEVCIYGVLTKVHGTWLKEMCVMEVEEL